MRIFAAVLLSLLAAWPALAGGRVALVIGNAAYKTLTPLNNPVVDAERMASILTANGFDVASCDGEKPGCYNLDNGAMANILEDFEDMADGADIAFVFYAGHGMQTADGNVLAPVNMELSCETLDPKRTILLDNVMKAVTGAHEKIVIVDACRNNPFQAQICAQRGAKPLSFDAIAVPESGAHFLLMSSTKPGDVAQDGAPGTHSPFARVLFRVMEDQAGLRFDQMLHSVTKFVIEETTAAKFTQVPDMLIRGEVPQGCLRGERCFVDPQAAALELEVQALKAANARSQEYEEIVVSLLSSAGYASLDGIPADQRESFFRGIIDASRALGERGDSAGERALAALKAGDESAAEKLFQEEAAARDRSASEEGRRAAESYRHLAALARPKDVAKAANYFALAAERDPSDIQTWMDLATTAKARGDTSEALRAYRKASALARDSGSDSQRVWAAFGQGDIVKAQGKLDRAQDLYTAARNIIEARYSADPDSIDVQRELSISLNKVGDIQVARGQLDSALKSYRQGLGLIANVAASNPDNSEWQHNLALTHNKIGDMIFARGDLAGALDSYQASFDIFAKLAEIDTASARWKRDMSVGNERIGDVKYAQGDLAGALEQYTMSLERMIPVRDSDLSNLEIQRFTAVTSLKVGDVLIDQGDLDAALVSYQDGLDMFQKLIISDEGNTEWQRDVAVAHIKIGDVREARDDHEGALEAYELSRIIRERLATSDRGNAVWQRDLSVNNERIGDIKYAQGDYEGALAQYEQSLNRMIPIRDADPTNMDLQRFTSITLNKIGDALQSKGDVAGASASFQASLGIAERLALSDPGNADWQWDYYVSLWRMGGDPAGGAGYFEKALAVLEKLHAQGRLSPPRVIWIERTRTKLEEARPASK